MANTTPDGPIKPYDELASSALDGCNTNGLVAHTGTGEQLTLGLEIVLVPGREGEKLQAIQARAIRDALLWAAQHKDDGDNTQEGGNDDHDE